MCPTYLIAGDAIVGLKLQVKSVVKNIAKNKIE